MKLEVGMYVRTNEGICKIDKIETETFSTPAYHLDINDECLYYGDVWFEDTKVSNNIIDLIEAGDYVNGSEVMEADWINEDGEYEEGLAFPMYASDDLNVIENWLPLKNVLIKSIVTSQQFESMQYKVD